MSGMPGKEHIVCLAPALLGPVPETLAQALGAERRLNLEWLLSRSTALSCAASGSEELLAERFPELPAAGPLIATTLTPKPYRFCYRAAPIHLRADRDRLLVFAGDDCALNQSESQAVCDSVNAFFKDDGITLVIHDGEWLLFTDTPPGPPLPPLSRVAGRYLDTVIPMDAEAKRWRQILNELQMLLHAHPVNQARETAGLLVANGLWAWGGGATETEMANASPKEGWTFKAESVLTVGNETVWLYDSAERALMQGDAGGWLAAVQSFEEGIARQWVEQCKAGDTVVELRVGHGMAWQLDQHARKRFWRRRRPLRNQIMVRD